MGFSRQVYWSGVPLPSPQQPRVASKKKKKAKWLLEDDYGLQKIEQVPQELNKSPRWLCLALHCLRYLATALGVDCAVLDSADAFFSLTLAADHKITLPSHRGSTGPFKELPQYYQPSPTKWHGMAV